MALEDVVSRGAEFMGQQISQDYERKRKEEEKKQPLGGYEKHAATTLHRLLFGNEPVDQIAREHAVGSVAARRGQAPQQGGLGAVRPASQAAGDAAFDQPTPPQLGGMANRALGGMATGGVNGGLGAAPDFPVSNAPLYQGAASPMTPTMGQRDTGQVQGGLSTPAPQMSAARPPPAAAAPQAPAQAGAAGPVSQPAPQGPPQGPQTKGDLELLMNLAHSGIGTMQQRSDNAALNATTRKQIADAQIQSREKIASGAEAGKGERQDKSIGMKQEQFDTHQKYLYDALDQAHRDKMAALSKDLKIAADKASKSNGKVDPAFSKELSDLRTRINSVTNDRAKLLSKKADVLSNPAEMERLQKEVDALGEEKKTLMGQFDEISTRVNKTPTVSGGSETTTSTKKKYTADELKKAGYSQDANGDWVKGK